MAMYGRQPRAEAFGNATHYFLKVTACAWQAISALKVAKSASPGHPALSRVKGVFRIFTTYLSGTYCGGR